MLVIHLPLLLLVKPTVCHCSQFLDPNGPDFHFWACAVDHGLSVILIAQRLLSTPIGSNTVAIEQYFRI